MLKLGSSRYVLPAKIYRYASLAAVSLVAASYWHFNPIPKIADFKLPGRSLQKVKTAGPRKIYPYSVIFGGAYSGEELVVARRVDSVVARHYAGFGRSAIVQHLPKETMMYVSYRKRNQVFWTKAKHRIPKGEAVLCDGDNLARTRCGNRLSIKPKAPVASNQEEPTEEALNIPAPPQAPLLATNPGIAAPDADFFVPAVPPDSGPLLPSIGMSAPPFSLYSGAGAESERPYAFGSSPPGSGPFLGNGLSYPNLGRSSSTLSNGVNGVGLLPSIEGVVTPEPGTTPLLCLGVLLSGGFALRSRRKA